MVMLILLSVYYFGALRKSSRPSKQMGKSVYVLLWIFTLSLDARCYKRRYRVTVMQGNFAHCILRQPTFVRWIQSNLDICEMFETFEARRHTFMEKMNSRLGWTHGMGFVQFQWYQPSDELWRRISDEVGRFSPFAPWNEVLCLRRALLNHNHTSESVQRRKNNMKLKHQRYMWSYRAR